MGLTGPAEIDAVATTAVKLDQTPLGAPRSCPPAERHTGYGVTLTQVPCPTPNLELACHYLDADCACSCSTGNQRSLAKAEVEHLENEESLPVLVRSMSTSRRYSWETPLSPVDTQRR